MWYHGHLARCLERTIGRFDLRSSLKIRTLDRTNMCMRRTANFRMVRERNRGAGVETGHFSRTYRGPMTSPNGVVDSAAPWGQLARSLEHAIQRFDLRSSAKLF